MKTVCKIACSHAILVFGLLGEVVDLKIDKEVWEIEQSVGV
jgi:hypothetical protein